MSTITDPRGFLILTLQNGDSREVHGYGVEILNTGGPQNEAGRLGKLFFTLVNDTADQARPSEPVMQAIPGTKRFVEFDKIRFFDPNYSLGVNSITIAVLTIPRSVWTDVGPLGVPRFRYLARSGAGGINLSAAGVAGDVALLYQNNGQVEDRFWQDEEYDTRHYWHGFVSGDGTFEIYVATKGTAFDPLRVYAQRFTSIDYTGANVTARMVAAQPGIVQKFVCTFTSGVNQNMMANTNIRIPIPCGLFEVYAVNLSVGAIRLDYVLGAVAHQ